jgi:hypothetical protein
MELLMNGDDQALLRYQMEEDDPDLIAFQEEALRTKLPDINLKV